MIKPPQFRKRAKPLLQAGTIELPKYPLLYTRIKPLARDLYTNFDVVIQVVGTARRRQPYNSAFIARCLRQHLHRDDPVAITLSSGTIAVRLAVNIKDTFAIQNQLRKALQMAKVQPGCHLALDLRRVSGKRKLSIHATYCALLATSAMPSFDSKQKKLPVSRVFLYGTSGPRGIRLGKIAAQANTLTRWLCILPSNILSAQALTSCAQDLSAAHNLECELFDENKLTDLKAGAFLSVTSKRNPGNLLRISYRCKNPQAKRIALIGKGVCFDTGGVNLKSHNSMLGMQGDMSGAAIVLAVILAATKLELPVHIDAWMAIAENLLEPESSKPGDIVVSHLGKSIEIIHTDAEGRMLLADTLSIASKSKPDVLATFATLTGTMIHAVGTRISGVTGNDQLVSQAQLAAASSGERLERFSLPDDYRDYLKSSVADLAQCSADSVPDHILAGLFLQEFTCGIPWLHLDLSATSNKGGLGAVPTDITGFGTNLALHWLMQHIRL